MSSTPTTEQAEVIGAKETRLLVSAAAGSGKTYVLVERYLQHVLSGVRPDEILTITFTKKAAAEMKRRIVDKLMGEGRREDAQIAETGPIQTIHGFCERILRENSVAAGLDPEFEIMAGEHYSALLGEAIAAALAAPQEDDSPVPDLLEAVAGRRLNRESDSPHQRLFEAVSEGIKALRGTRIDPDRLEQLYAPPARVQLHWEETVLGQMPPAVQEAFAQGKSAQGALPGRESFDQTLRRIHKELNIRVPEFLRAGPSDPEGAAKQTCALVQLVVSTWRRLEAAMKQRHELDFTLLESMAVNLVQSNSHVKARLRKQFRVVFVDESQDLNPMQYRLLDAVGIEHEMLVGDAQQSIYGFRLADARLFQSRSESGGARKLPLSKNWRSDDGILEFVDTVFSFHWKDYQRMAPRLEPDQNVLFMDGVERSFDGVEGWMIDERDPAATALMVKELLAEIPPLTAKDVCILVRGVRAGIEIVRALARQGVPAQMVGGTDEYYTRMEIRDVSNALRALTDPHDDYALLAVLRSPFVGVSLDTLVLLSHKEEGDEHSIFERITLPDRPTLPEEDEILIATFMGWFKPLHAYADRLAAWEVISELLATTSYLEALARRANGSQLVANVRKLLAVAAKLPDQGAFAFAEQVREIQRMRHREGDAPTEDEDTDMVKVMTIHKAKGLEFPVVIVPETHSRISTKRSPDVEADSTLEMVATKLSDSKSIFAEFLAQRRRERASAEEWRVLYVAMTRAKSRLCVVLDSQRRPDRFSGAIARAIRLEMQDPPPGMKIRNPGSGKPPVN